MLTVKMRSYTQLSICRPEQNIVEHVMVESFNLLVLIKTDTSCMAGWLVKQSVALYCHVCGLCSHSGHEPKKAFH
jgi:hypothetical protein